MLASLLKKQYKNNDSKKLKLCRSKTKFTVQYQNTWQGRKISELNMLASVQYKENKFRTDHNNNLQS